MAKKKYRPWLRALSGLSINISAAWFANAFIGPNISLPRNTAEIFSLTLSLVLGIVFLLITVWLERKLEK